jgi:hypothetical protein
MYREPVVTADSSEKKTIVSGGIKATGILLHFSGLRKPETGIDAVSEYGYRHLSANFFGAKIYTL